MLFFPDKKPGFLRVKASNWNSDQRIRALSFEARAVLMEMAMIMVEGSPYGYLRINGLQVTEERLATILGTSVKKLKPILEELVLSFIIYQDRDDACYFCPELQRMREFQAKKSEAGKVGGRRGFQTMMRKRALLNNASELPLTPEHLELNTPELNLSSKETKPAPTLESLTGFNHLPLHKNDLGACPDQTEQNTAIEGVAEIDLEQNGEKDLAPPLTLSLSIIDSIDNSNNTILNNNMGEKKFVKPTEAQVKQYMRDIEYPANHETESGNFIDFYTSKGWKVGKTPMKDWKAAIRTWKGRIKKANKQGSNNKFASQDNNEQF